MAEEALRHTLTLNDRQQLQMSGITDVLNFDEESIAAKTEEVIIIIRGEGLHIGSLSLEKGNLSVTGRIDAVIYDEDVQKRQGFLSRVFK